MTRGQILRRPVVVGNETPVPRGGGETDNAGIAEKLQLLDKQLGRLEERFGTERELALQEGSREALIALRNRSREIYQVEAHQLEDEALVESHAARPDEPGFEEVQERLRDLRRKLSRILAMLIGTPNRLLRNADTVADLAPTRESTVQPVGAASAVWEGEEQLVETDPPVACPLCGRVLLTDARMTVLVCPDCGIRETVED